MSSDRNFNICNILFQDLNELKERVKTLEKENSLLKETVNKEVKLQVDKLISSQSSTIVTDIYLVENVLKVIKYDIKNNTSIIQLINFPGKDDQNSIITLPDSELPEKQNNGSYLTIDDAAAEIDSIFNQND